MAFKNGKGTRDAIFQRRIISERITQMNKKKEIQGKMTTKKKKIYLYFVDYQKTFDRVRHDKLVEVMEKAIIPDLERRLIIHLYWRQHAAVRWDGEVSREVDVERGVRQGCVISPPLGHGLGFLRGWRSWSLSVYSGRPRRCLRMVKRTLNLFYSILFYTLIYTIVEEEGI